MIDLYYWTTPNGHKITLFLEEAGLPYRIVPINIGKGEQFQPDFLKIAPNNRIPAIVDTAPTGGGEPISVFESGAILIYLAEKTGKLLPTDPALRYEAIQWLMFQMSGVGPMMGQANVFYRYFPEKIPAAIERYQKEGRRLFEVMNTQLAKHQYLAGDEYTIADMAVWPWFGNVVLGNVYDAAEFLDAGSYKHVQRWAKEIASRPAVKRGRIVNRTNGPLNEQLHERHDASDFDTQTEDKRQN